MPFSCPNPNWQLTAKTNLKSTNSLGQLIYCGPVCTSHGMNCPYLKWWHLVGFLRIDNIFLVWFYWNGKGIVKCGIWSLYRQLTWRIRRKKRKQYMGLLQFSCKLLITTIIILMILGQTQGLFGSQVKLMFCRYLSYCIVRVKKTHKSWLLQNFEPKSWTFWSDMEKKNSILK